MQRRNPRKREVLDKPAYALGEEPGLSEGDEPRAKEARMELRDRLGEGAFAKLKQLKSEMAESAAAPAGSTAKRRKSAVATAAVQESEESFADLLNPKDNPEESFEDLFSRSKLDWRSFK